MLTTSYELVKHSYSPHFVDEGSGAQRGPWGCCLKAQILLRTCGRAGVRDTKPPHGSQLSRHEQGVSLSRLAVCSTGDHRGDTCWVWAGGSWLCPVLSPHPHPGASPGACSQDETLPIWGSPLSWVVGIWSQTRSLPRGWQGSPLMALGAARGLPGPQATPLPPCSSLQPWPLSRSGARGSALRNR